MAWGAPLVGADSGTMTPDAVERRAAIARALFTDSMKDKPIRHWLQGAAQLADTGVSAALLNKADEAGRSGMSAQSAALASILGGGQPGASPMASSPAVSPVAQALTGTQGNQIPDGMGSIGGWGSKDNLAGTPTPQGGMSNPYGDAATVPNDLSGQGGVKSPAAKASFDYLTKMKGYTPAQAAGMVGNFAGESGTFNPNEVHDNGIGLGIAGWNGDRLKNLYAFAQQTGQDPRSRQTQLDFAHHELNTTESGAGDALRAAQTPEQAAAAMVKYERPRDAASAIATRSGLARQLLNSNPQVASLDPSIGLPPPVPQTGGIPDTGAPAQAAPSPMGGAGPQMAGLPPAQLPPSAQPQPNQQVAQAAPQAQPAPDMKANIAKMLQNPNPYVQQMGLALAQKAMVPPQFTTIGTDRDGNPIHGFVDPFSQKVTPAGVVGGQPAGPQTAQNDQPQATGTDYLDQMRKQDEGRANLVQGMLEGRVSPPQLGRAGTPRVMSLMKDAATVEPGFDMTKWGQRTKLIDDMSKSTPNSMGGILSNGKSAFGHLARLSDSLTDLGNYNGPDIPGGGHLGSAANYISNAVLPTSETKGKIVGINDNALKYGQEATKFYAGTGGGEAERMNALQTLNPKTMSGQEQAAFLRSERDLMVERMRQKENQIRDTLGQGWLDKHPVIDDDLKNHIQKLDKNIAVLAGKAPMGLTQSAPQVPQGGGPDPEALAEAKRRGLIP